MNKIKHNNINKEGIYPCTGCSVCSVACPKKAITIELTGEGFYEPIIDDTLCVNCGLCIKNCYKYDAEASNVSSDNIKTYSAINLDSEKLKNVASGGVASELARQCIEDGYKVLGVAYDYDENIAITKIAQTVDETEEFKGSKYFQSFTEKAFEETLKDDSEQRYAVFGTPCQIYAVNKYVTSKNRKDKFLLIDTFCHGCPSLNLWKKYLQHTKAKVNFTEFKKIEFRSKAHGWHEFCFTFKGNNTQHNTSKINDPFYTMFFDGNALNKACYDCKLRSTLNYADIRLGDYWGERFDTNITGVSAVIVCTENGEKLFEKISDKFTIESHSFKQTIKAQSYGKEHNFDSKKRQVVLTLLASNLPMAEVFKNSKKSYSAKKRIKMLSKNLVKILPRPVYFRIKKFIHSM
jgi:coenzyme F420-reducing hydrogenase beta subunit